jgi:YspA, cpYpsA-related SLOG family
MRVLVCGGRSYTARTELFAELDRLHAEYCFDTVIAGGTRGVDTLAIEWAQRRNIATQLLMAEWTRFGRKSGPLWNARMLAEGRPDLVIAFPGGHRTANMVKQAKAAGIWVLTVD